MEKNLFDSSIKTIEQITKYVSYASDKFEKTNTPLKVEYIKWNIEAFNLIARKINKAVGSFGTGYPFYALDSNLEGTLPIIKEQFRYNRELRIHGEAIKNIAWKCQKCLKQNYDEMPDLKSICKPCPNIPDTVKPRKLINRLPDIDMWIICEDGTVEIVQEEVTRLFKKYKLRTSDVDPLLSIQEVLQIVEELTQNKKTEIFLPIDAHIMEYSKMKKLIEQVPEILSHAKKNNIVPFLPIHPKSLRKNWQYDDSAYNFIYDFLSAFTCFNIPESLKESVNMSRKKVAQDFTDEELMKFLIESATPANQRRFKNKELRKIFLGKMHEWRDLEVETEVR